MYVNRNKLSQANKKQRETIITKAETIATTKKIWSNEYDRNEKKREKKSDEKKTQNSKWNMDFIRTYTYIRTE